MVLLTAAVGATGAAVALALVGRSREGQETQIVVGSNACVKTLGAAVCLSADSWRRASRHVSLMGELLVISRRPDSAESWFQLRGTHVAWDGCTVTVVLSSGANLATFWLSSPAEAARWARELASAATSLSKMVSLHGRHLQMDTIRSTQALWELKIEQEMSRLNSEVGSFKDLPNTPGLDRHRIEGSEEFSNVKEGQVADPQGQLAVVQATPRTLRISELEKRLAQAEELPKLLSLNRRQVHDLVRQTAEREAELAAVRQQVLHKRAQERLKPRIIASTTTSVRQGSRPFDTIPKDQMPFGPRSPQESLSFSDGDWMAVLDA